MELYIGNKNYSSWSLRAWLLMKQAGIAFSERQLRFDHSEGSPFATTLLALAPTARVPLLVDEGFAVWDSLAIAEYLAERFPEKRLWPLDPRQRARARSLCAEMHSGFPGLRSRCPMNVEASLPEVHSSVHIPTTASFWRKRKVDPVAFIAWRGWTAAYASRSCPRRMRCTLR